MADNALTVVIADGTTQKMLRSKTIAAGGEAQVVLQSEGPETIPTLTGATLGLISVTPSAAVALDPPDAGARKCLIRAWETSHSPNHRLFVRRDGTAPTNAGANCEFYLLHTEGDIFAPDSGVFTNYKLIAETGSAWQITCRWSNT